MDKKSIGKGISAVLTANIFSLVLGLVLSIITARYLGPVLKGQLAYFRLVGGTISTLMMVGIYHANVYFLSSAKYEKKSLFINASIVLIIQLIAGTLTYILIINNNSVWISRTLAEKIIIAISTCNIIFIYTHIDSMFVSLRKYKKVLVQKLIFVGIPLLVYLIVIVKHYDFSIMIPIYGVLLANIAVIIYLIIVIYGNVKCRIKGNKVGLRNYLDYGLKAHIANIAWFIVLRSDGFFIKYYLTDEALGVYSIAVNIASMVWLASLSIRYVISPILIERSNSKEITRKLLPILMSMGIPLIIIAVTVAGPVINMMYGVSYMGAVVPLIVLLAAAYLQIARSILVGYYNSERKQLTNAMTRGIAIVINVGMNIVLIPKYGIIGAAVSSLVAYGIDAIWALYIFQGKGKPISIANPVNVYRMLYIQLRSKKNNG